MPEFRNVFPILLLSPLLLLPSLLGCDSDERKLRSWQQEQVTELQRQSKENSAAAQALVVADAASRRQFVALEHAVQAERQALADQYTALESDRKMLDALRQRMPLVATLFQGMAVLMLGTVVLWVCGRLLGRASSDDGATELEETLILSITGESDLLAETPRLDSSATRSMLPGSTIAEAALTQE
jgi:hypothetical protein